MAGIESRIIVIPAPNQSYQTLDAGPAGTFFAVTGGRGAPPSIQQFTWKEERFNAELLDKMQGAYRFTQAFVDERHVTLRQAAFAIGIQRVADAAKLRGYI